MKLIVLTLLSWAAGVAGLLLSYAALFEFRPTFSGGYLMKFLFISLAVAFVAFPVIYLPCMLLLRSLLHGCTKAGWFAVVAALLGIIPTFLVFLSQPPEVAAVFSSEAFVHYCMFTAAGVVFGLGFVRVSGRAAKT